VLNGKRRDRSQTLIERALASVLVLLVGGGIAIVAGRMGDTTRHPAPAPPLGADLSLAPVTTQWNLGPPPITRNYIFIFTVTLQHRRDVELQSVDSETSGASIVGFIENGREQDGISPSFSFDWPEPAPHQPVSFPRPGALYYVSLYVTGSCKRVKTMVVDTIFVTRTTHETAAQQLTWPASLNGCDQPAP
jgi:hypothetical protein